MSHGWERLFFWKTDFVEMSGSHRKQHNILCIIALWCIAVAVKKKIFPFDTLSFYIILSIILPLLSYLYLLLSNVFIAGLSMEYFQNLVFVLLRQMIWILLPLLPTNASVIVKFGHFYTYIHQKNSFLFVSITPYRRKCKMLDFP